MEGTRDPLFRLVAVALAARVAGVPGRAEAQEDHAASRTLGGTTFMLPALADSAFVLTEFGFRQGINYQQIPNFPVSSLIRFDLAWVEFEERIDLAVRITPWLGVYAQGVASAALGPDTPSLLFEGGGLDFGGKGGVVLRLYRNERTRSQVAVRAYGGGDAGRKLDLPDFFEAFGVRAANDVVGPLQHASTTKQVASQLESEAFNLAETNYSNIVLYRTSTVRTGGSVHYAQGLVAPLTVQLAANVEWSWNQQTPYNATSQAFETVSTSDTSVTVDAVLSMALNRWSVPLGISAEYGGVTTALSVGGAASGSATTQYAGGGLWFTGRRGVEIGALALTERSLQPLNGFATASTSSKPTGYSVALIFRALW
jgi:hypothetical protein